VEMTGRQYVVRCALYQSLAYINLSVCAGKQRYADRVRDFPVSNSEPATRGVAELNGDGEGDGRNRRRAYGQNVREVLALVKRPALTDLNPCRRPASTWSPHTIAHIHRSLIDTLPIP